MNESERREHAKKRMTADADTFTVIGTVDPSLWDVPPSGPEREAALEKLKANLTSQLLQENGEAWIQQNQHRLEQEWDHLVKTFL